VEQTGRTVKKEKKCDYAGIFMEKVSIRERRPKEAVGKRWKKDPERKRS